MNGMIILHDMEGNYVYIARKDISMIERKLLSNYDGEITIHSEITLEHGRQIMVRETPKEVFAEYLED